MKILFLNQFFWPDASATSQLLCDLTGHLADSGETVEVICGSASYGEVASGPKPNVQIRRLRNSSFSRKFGGRIGSYLSFFAGAVWQGMRIKSPDVVVTLTTPPLISLVGMLIQKLRGARHVIWEMDVYPDVAIDLGVFRKNSTAARMFGFLADLPRKHADRVIVLGECMRARLLAHGISEEKMFVAENWADADESTERNGPAPLPSAQGPLTILYSGNFGLAHDVDTVSKALVEFNPGSRTQGVVDAAGAGIRFVFAGAGSRLGWLRTFCRDRRITNVDFLPYCERRQLGARLASGHIGLVAQKEECLGSAVPSKTYGIMAAGRPVLFIGPRSSTPGRIIERYGCGWQIDCGDHAGLARLLRELNQNRELIAEAGDRAHRAFTAHYRRVIGVARIARIIECRREVPTPARAHAAVG